MKCVCFLDRFGGNRAGFPSRQLLVHAIFAPLIIFICIWQGYFFQLAYFLSTEMASSFASKCSLGTVKFLLIIFGLLSLWPYILYLTDLLLFVNNGNSF